MDNEEIADILVEKSNEIKRQLGNFFWEKDKEILGDTSDHLKTIVWNDVFVSLIGISNYHLKHRQYLDDEKEKKRFEKYMEFAKPLADEIRKICKKLSDWKP